MFFSPSKIDSEGKFAQFLNKEQWESLVNNIDDYYKYIKEMTLDPHFFDHFKYNFSENFLIKKPNYPKYGRSTH